MKMTPGAAQLAVAAIGRAERRRRLLDLYSMRVATNSSVQGFEDYARKLKKD